MSLVLCRCFKSTVSKSWSLIFEATTIEGKGRGVNVVLKFESEAAAMKWYNDPDYEPVKKIRLDSTTNGTAVLAKQFVPPSE